MICEYCGNDYSKYGIKNHIEIVHKKTRLAPKKGKQAWNKGLTKETDIRVKRIAETFSNNLITGKTKHGFTGKHLSEEHKLKISKKLSINNKGGRCKWFKYKKPSGDIIKLQGTWELRFAKILDIIDETWIKIGFNQNGNKDHTFIWIDNNNTKHHYTPDFYSPKLKTYYEVKGYWWGDDKLKMKLVKEQYKNINIKVIEKKDLEELEKNLL